MNNISKLVAAAALSAAAIPAAFATSGSTWVGGEIGFTSHPTQSQASRSQVQEGAQQRGATTADGYDVVGGELGYAPHQHRYVTAADGQRQHADSYPARSLGAAPAPPPSAPAGTRPSWPSAQDLMGGPN
jgi:hypothetical protein